MDPMESDGPNTEQEKKIEAIERDGFIEILIRNQTFLRDEAKEFQSIVSKALSKEITRFLINFGDCQYISSEGLGCIAEFWRNCTEKEDFKMVSLFNEKPVNELLNFFEIIGLARVMKGHIFIDKEKARDFLLK
jgi:anti-anti-sigma regulatory factor